MSDKRDIGKVASFGRFFGMDWAVDTKLPRRDQLAVEGSFARAFNPIYLGKGPEPENPGGEWMSVMDKFTGWSRGLISTETLIAWLEERPLQSGLAEAATAYLGMKPTSNMTTAIERLKKQGAELQFEHALNYWEPRITTIFVQNFKRWGSFAFNSMIENLLAREVLIFHSVYLHQDEDAYQVKLKCHGENGLWIAFMVTHEVVQDIVNGQGGKVLGMGVRPDQTLVKPIEKMNADEFAREFRRQAGGVRERRLQSDG